MPRELASPEAPTAAERPLVAAISGLIDQMRRDVDQRIKDAEPATALAMGGQPEPPKERWSVTVTERDDKGRIKAIDMQKVS